MIEIYWASGSPMAWPIQLALKEKKLPHESIRISFSAEENRTPEFLAMNPRGKVPVLRDGEVVVYEAHAVLDYLERRYQTHPLLPDNPTAQVRDTTRRFETSYIYPAADAAISYTSYSSTLRRDEWDLEHLTSLQKPLFEEFSRWEEYLDGRTWIGGEDRIGQADVFFIPLMFYMHRFGFDFAARELPNLQSYFDRTYALASVQSTWPPHWREQAGDPTFTKYH